MKTLITCLLMLCAWPVVAQDLPKNLPPVPEDERPAGWYIQRAGHHYNSAVYLTVVTSLLGGSLMLTNDQGLQTTGAVLAGAGVVAGLTFTIRGNGKLERAGWLMQQGR